MHVYLPPPRIEEHVSGARPSRTAKRYPTVYYTVCLSVLAVATLPTAALASRVLTVFGMA